MTFTYPLLGRHFLLAALAGIVTAGTELAALGTVKGVRGRAADGLQLLIFAGAPLSQTIYGMIIMFIIMGAAGDAALLASKPGIWFVYMMVGVLSGVSMGVSALWQGLSAAASADAFAETGKGFTNQLMVLGIVETVAIFVMAFAIVLLSSF